MAPDDRALAERVHVTVSGRRPELSPKTWYGMPSYATQTANRRLLRTRVKFGYRYSNPGLPRTRQTSTTATCGRLSVRAQEVAPRRGEDGHPTGCRPRSPARPTSPVSGRRPGAGVGVGVGSGRAFVAEVRGTHQRWWSALRRRHDAPTPSTSFPSWTLRGKPSRRRLWRLLGQASPICSNHRLAVPRRGTSGNCLRGQHLPGISRRCCHRAPRTPTAVTRGSPMRNLPATVVVDDAGGPPRLAGRDPRPRRHAVARRPPGSRRVRRAVCAPTAACR